MCSTVEQACSVVVLLDQISLESDEPSDFCVFAPDVASKGCFVRSMLLAINLHNPAIENLMHPEERDLRIALLSQPARGRQGVLLEWIEATHPLDLSHES